MNSYTWALSASVAWGLAAALEKWGLSDSDALTGVWLRSIGVLLGAIVMTFFIPQLSLKVSHMGPRQWTGILMGGALGSIVGQIFFYRGLKVGEIGRVASVAGSWPLIAFLLSILFLNETPTLKKILGAILVVSGVWLLK